MIKSEEWADSNNNRVATATATAAAARRRQQDVRAWADPSVQPSPHTYTSIDTLPNLDHKMNIVI